MTTPGVSQKFDEQPPSFEAPKQVYLFSGVLFFCDLTRSRNDRAAWESDASRR